MSLQHVTWAVDIPICEQYTSVEKARTVNIIYMYIYDFFSNGIHSGSTQCDYVHSLTVPTSKFHGMVDTQTYTKQASVLTDSIIPIR